MGLGGNGGRGTVGSHSRGHVGETPSPKLMIYAPMTIERKIAVLGILHVGIGLARFRRRQSLEIEVAERPVRWFGISA